MSGYVEPNEIPVDFMPGCKIVSRFGGLHVIEKVSVDDGGLWLTLKDGREFHIDDFVPYEPELHAGPAEPCEGCGL